MARGRNIFFSKECDRAAAKLGGYERVDDSLIPVFDGLERNPYGFSHIESDWFSGRFIVTAPYMETPALVWIFRIEPNGDVVIEHVEEYEGYLSDQG